MMRQSPYLLAGLLCLASLPATAGQVYKWTDASGQVHYSENPPPSSATQSTTVQLKTKLPEDAAAAQAARNKAQADRAKASAEKEGSSKPATTSAKPDYAERCAKLRSDLKVMNEHARVKVQGTDGEIRVMAPEEKAKMLDEKQREIKAFCES